MRAVCQRAQSASVTVDGKVVGSFEGEGLVILLGVSVDDTKAEAVQVAAKIAGLRMLDGEVSLLDAGAPALVVSQFTLYGDVRKGRRPSWTRAARGDQAEPLYERFMAELESSGVRVERGVFGATMDVSLTNSGPFTLIVDSAELGGPRRG
ncbi:D-aminoacyl-tRNA deacylase [Micrococcus luteus]|uniref:D-aminoacyl-tRNA deacylase n=1 Tax=Micrococcus luteus TaxID=1270 RepID=UPI000C7A0525|nr:D-aminoacyl-tRNA deacylase [Micrococcus luteus]MCV7527320.1 D-aminoacyl-tRNA deacylase [Micrococcus luteus]PLA46960.1 D-tyrosyl-tRNA(Tyr) deacylase [Micrococcus luteus]